MSTTQPGWVGPQAAVLNYLALIGADKDENGDYILHGPPGESPVSFMGAGDELLVPASTHYLVEGRRIPLAANMPKGRGSHPVVII